MATPAASCYAQGMARRFENKVVWITGGGSGIGRALALAFADEGATVAMTTASGFELPYTKLTDRNGRIQSTNPAFTAITGFAADEVLGQNPRILQSGMQSRDFYDAMWQSITDTGHWQGEIVNRRKNGEAYTQWLNINAVKDGSSRVTHYVGVTFDISELKASERIKDEFIATVSHELRTPLANLKAYADLLNIEEGIDEHDYSGPVVKRTEHRAGVIKVAGSDGGPSERDEPIFEAAAIAQRATGCPILTHCENGTGALEQVALLGHPRQRLGAEGREALGGRGREGDGPARGEGVPPRPLGGVGEVDSMLSEVGRGLHVVRAVRMLRDAHGVENGRASTLRFDFLRRVVRTGISSSVAYSLLNRTAASATLDS